VAEQQQRAVAERQQRALERYRVRRWWTAAATVVVTAAAMAGFFLYLDTWAALQDAHEELSEIAAQLERRGQPAEAEALYRRMLGNDEPRFGTFAGTLIARNDLAMLLMRQGRLEECAQEFERLLADVQGSFLGGSEALGFDEPDVAWVTSNYGECLFRGGKLEQARRVLESAQATLLKVPDDSRYRRGLGLNTGRLRELYRALGLPAEEAALPK
jgi:tetratricopeptide (TPR) repeat protein